LWVEADEGRILGLKLIEESLQGELAFGGEALFIYGEALFVCSEVMVKDALKLFGGRIDEHARSLMEFKEAEEADSQLMKSGSDAVVDIHRLALSMLVVGARWT